MGFSGDLFYWLYNQRLETTYREAKEANDVRAMYDIMREVLVSRTGDPGMRNLTDQEIISAVYKVRKLARPKSRAPVR